MALYLQLLCYVFEIVEKKIGKKQDTETNLKKLVSFGVKSYDNIGYFINVIVFFSLQLAVLLYFATHKMTPYFPAQMWGSYSTRHIPLPAHTK